MITLRKGNRTITIQEPEQDFLWHVVETSEQTKYSYYLINKKEVDFYVQYLIVVKKYKQV